MTVRGLGALAVVVAIAAGGCSDRTARTTPEPDVAIPPPLPGLVDGVAQIVSNPSDREGYTTGEKIIVVVETEKPVSVERSPRLRIEIGDHVRLADFRPAAEDDWLPDQPSRRWRFEYTVACDDLDLDGISISKRTLANALFLVDGRFVWVTVTAVVSRDPSGDRLQAEPGQNLFSHRITRPREARVCTEYRELAADSPGSVTQTYPWQHLAILDRLAERLSSCSRRFRPMLGVVGLIPEVISEDQD